MLVATPFYFQRVSHNTTVASTCGDAFTAAANNADGAVVALGTLTHEAHYLIVGLGGANLNAVATYALADIVIDPAGGTSWASFIDDLTFGFSLGVSTPGEMRRYWHFPIFVPSGAALGVRARTSHTADLTTCRCTFWAYGSPTRPEMWWHGRKVETLGVTPASSAGTSVTPGSAGAYGSWTTIGTAGANYRAVQIGFNGSDAASNAAGLSFQIGINSQQLAGIPDIWAATSNAEAMGAAGQHMPFYCDIPAGTQVQVRAASTGTAEAHQVALYGVY